MICHYVQTDAILNDSKFLDTNGRPDEKFSSSGRMLLTNKRPDGIPRRPDGCKGTELTDLNSAQSLLEAHYIPVKAATLHRSDFVQQNAANTKTNKIPIWPF
jgi:hypothetical protein